MPTLFNYGPYKVFIWSNEGDPPEPIHIHVAKGVPRSSSPKFWLTSYGVFKPADNSYEDMRKMLIAIEKFIGNGGVKKLKDYWIEVFNLDSEDDINYYK